MTIPGTSDVQPEAFSRAALKRHETGAVAEDPRMYASLGFLLVSSFLKLFFSKQDSLRLKKPHFQRSC